MRSRSLTGKPARMLRSAWTDAWEEEGAPSTLPMPDQTMLTAVAQQRINRRAGDPGSGANQLATYFVGQIVGSMNAVRPARQVMLDLVTEYADAASASSATWGSDGGAPAALTP